MAEDHPRPRREESSCSNSSEQGSNSSEEMEKLREELRYCREQFHITLRAIGDGFISTDEQGKITYLNPEGERLTGWPLEEAVGKPLQQVFRIYHTKTGREEPNPAWKVLQSGKKEGLANDTTLLSREGVERQIADSAAPILNETGEVEGVVLIFYDITEQYRLREQLRKSEEMLRKTQEIASLGSWELDLQRNYLAWSDEVYRIFGLDPQEFSATYQAFLNMVHPEDREKVDQAYHNSVQLDKEGYDIEHRIVRKDNGEVRYVHEKCNHFKDEQGQIVRSLGMVQDITERRRVEKELARQKNLLQASIEALTHPFYVIDVSTYEVLLANSASGLPPGGRPTCYQLTHLRETPCDGSEHPCPLEIIKETGQPAGVEHVHFDPQGRARTVSVHSYPLFNESGELVQVIEYTIDITERKEREKHLARFRQALDSSADSIYLIDCSTYNFVDANQPAYRTLGYTYEELLELTPFDIKPYLPREELKEKFASTIDGSSSQHYGCEDSNLGETFETYHQRKDGSCFPVEISLRLANLPQEKMLVASVRDITYRKEAEKRLSDYAMELEFKNVEIENLYQQLDQEVDKARRLHERSLPEELPQGNGISAAAHYQAALRMGGDFYFLRKVGDQMVFFLSDVSGHGMDGAIVSTFVKDAVESYLTLCSGPVEPNDLLRHLEKRYRQENYPLDYFLSLVIGVLSLESRKLSFCGAGFQESLLVADSQGNCKAYHTEGLPLSNAIPPELFKCQVTNLYLDIGSTVMLNTDGLTEQLRGGESFASKRWESFQNNCRFPPEALIYSINEDFWEFNGGSLQGDDDITMLVLQIDPSDKQHYHWELMSTKEELERLNAEVYQVFAAHLPDDFLFQGVHELVANAMEHGNQFNPEKAVGVTLEVTSRYLFVTVEDEGSGFDWWEKKNVPGNIDFEGERGRGIMLTRQLGEKLFYNNRGNKAYLVIPA